MLSRATQFEDHTESSSCGDQPVRKGWTRQTQKTACMIGGVPNTNWSLISDMQRSSRRGGLRVLWTAGVRSSTVLPRVGMVDAAQALDRGRTARLFRRERVECAKAGLNGDGVGCGGPPRQRETAFPGCAIVDRGRSCRNPLTQQEHEHYQRDRRPATGNNG